MVEGGMDSEEAFSPGVLVEGRKGAIVREAD